MTSVSGGLNVSKASMFVYIVKKMQTKNHRLGGYLLDLTEICMSAKIDSRQTCTSQESIVPSLRRIPCRTFATAGCPTCSTQSARAAPRRRTRTRPRTRDNTWGVSTKEGGTRCPLLHTMILIFTIILFVSSVAFFLYERQNHEIENSLGMVSGFSIVIFLFIMSYVFVSATSMALGALKFI